MANIRASIMKRINALRHDDIALIKHGPYRLLLDRRNRLDHKLAGGMFWEWQLRDRAVQEVKAHRLDLFIDAGANLGLYTIDLNLRAGPIETIAFEPQPDSYNQLCGNIFANGLSDHVRAERAALSTADGTAEMAVDSDSNIHSSLLANPHDAARFDRRITVPLICFDSHYPVENRRIFLKMDIEGHELEALEGMRLLLTRNKGSLQIECGAGERLEKLQKMMAECGYRETGNYAANYYFTNLDD